MAECNNNLSYPLLDSDLEAAVDTDSKHEARWLPESGVWIHFPYYIGYLS